jgi:hypothetical protein
MFKELENFVTGIILEAKTEDELLKKLKSYME